MIRHFFALLAILSGAIALETPGQTAGPRGPVIRQVDHILVESGDPKALLSFFTDTLQMPAAWPISDSNGFVSGGLGAGDVNLEFFRYADRKEAPARRKQEARFVGLAFEPHPLANALRMLQIRGIPHNPPEPFISTLPRGSQGVLWTTVALPSFARPGMSIFLYECSQAFLKVDVRRKQIGNRLILNNGGPIGFRSVREIVIAATNIQKETAKWSQLMGEPTPQGNWRASAGPAIRLIQENEDRIKEIVFEVESLERAKAFLKQNRLLGSVSSQKVYLNPSKIQKLKIGLVD